MHPLNRTSRIDGTADHARTYEGGVTDRSVLEPDAKDSDVCIT